MLSGSAFAGGVTNPYDPSKPADAGHFLVAIKPDLFMSVEDFRARMQVLYDVVRGSQPMSGVDKIFMPGEIERMTEKQRRHSGIPMKAAEVQALNDEARRVGVANLKLG